MGISHLAFIHQKHSTWSRDHFKDEGHFPLTVSGSPSSVGQGHKKDYNNMTVWLMLQELSFSDPMAGIPVHAHSKFSKLTASITGFDIFLNSPNCCKSHDFYFRLALMGNFTVWWMILKHEFQPTKRSKCTKFSIFNVVFLIAIYVYTFTNHSHKGKGDFSLSFPKYVKMKEDNRTAKNHHHPLLHCGFCLI